MGFSDIFSNIPLIFLTAMKKIQYVDSMAT